MGRESREVWAKRVERWRDSGLSVREFAREVGVNANTLSGWRWRLRAEQLGRAPSTERGQEQRTPAEEVKPIEFVELVRPRADERFEVVAASGWTVRVPAQFDAEALGRLLAVLERR